MSTRGRSNRKRDGSRPPHQRIRIVIAHGDSAGFMPAGHVHKCCWNCAICSRCAALRTRRFGKRSINASEKYRRQSGAGILGAFDQSMGSTIPHVATASLAASVLASTKRPIDAFHQASTKARSPHGCRPDRRLRNQAISTHQTSDDCQRRRSCRTVSNPCHGSLRRRLSLAGTFLMVNASARLILASSFQPMGIATGAPSLARSE